MCSNEFTQQILSLGCYHTESSDELLLGRIVRSRDLQIVQLRRELL